MREHSKFILLFFVLASIVYATDNDVLYCQADGVKVRTEPNPVAEIIGQLNTNDQICPNDGTEYWYRIKYGQHDGWVHKSLFKDEEVKTDKTN